jgi:hypothetical protein
MMGLPRCMTFSGSKVNAAVARELLRAVESLRIEATFEAERMHRERQEVQRHIHDLELQQARYDTVEPIAFDPGGKMPGASRFAKQTSEGWLKCAA